MTTKALAKYTEFLQKFQIREKHIFQLYRELGLIETIQVDKPSKLINQNAQSIQYLLVLDFEATCWEKNARPYIPPEIIEFPVILYKIQTAEILSEFQQYVTPTEHYKLSEFCKSFTGITQEQVDSGCPLQTTLMLFTQWFKEIEQKFHLVLNRNCVFVTWTDWDLGTCLLNECKRKRIKRLEYFLKWTDLRALYKEFYNRIPRGLKGALHEVGLEFVGSEHCGLQDARNTARLAGRMIQEGVLIRITKDLNF